MTAQAINEGRDLAQKTLADWKNIAVNVVNWTSLDTAIWAKPILPDNRPSVLKYRPKAE